MATAKEKFKVGDRVRFSEEGKKQGFGRLGASTATVVGFGRRGYSLRVVKDGCKSSDSYHMDFWEKDE